LALLEVRDVTVRFGGITAVSEASLSVEQATVQGLIGPNGAGKTTTFNVISGLQAPTEGRVLIDGDDVTAEAIHDRARRGMARTFQRLEVFGSLTVLENVLAAAEFRASWDRGGDERPREVAERLLERIGIGEFADVPADAVPTGIARLTELGRALAIRPRLLLLDEPSSGLSEEEPGDLGQVLLSLAGEGMGILMVEHDVDLVMRVCSWIDVLDFGRVIASGDAAAIRADERVQAAYLGAAPVGEEVGA
jgi:branched-chain amino acid transport system ATP-binding protein